MKKKITLALCATMALTVLTACGGAETPAAFSRGVIDGDTYTSEFNGLTFTAPTDWTYYTDEQLLELAGTSMDAIGSELTDSELALELSKQATIYDMMATNTDGSVNVIVMYENLEVTHNSALTEEDYAAAMKQNLENLTNINYIVGDTSSAEMGGKTFLTLSADVDGYGIHQEYYFLKLDNYMLCISFTNSAAPASTGIAECFAAA